MNEEEKSVKEERKEKDIEVATGTQTKEKKSGGSEGRQTTRLINKRKREKSKE